MRMVSRLELERQEMRDFARVRGSNSISDCKSNSPTARWPRWPCIRFITRAPSSRGGMPPRSSGSRARKISSITYPGDIFDFRVLDRITMYVYDLQSSAVVAAFAATLWFRFSSFCLDLVVNARLHADKTIGSSHMHDYVCLCGAHFHFSLHEIHFWLGAS